MYKAAVGPRWALGGQASRRVDGDWWLRVLYEEWSGQACRERCLDRQVGVRLVRAWKGLAWLGVFTAILHAGMYLLPDCVIFALPAFG